MEIVSLLQSQIIMPVLVQGGLKNVLRRRSPAWQWEAVWLDGLRLGILRWLCERDLNRQNN